ncbi:MarR family winged helix-turn-helix transcriptional regulator [Actinomadura sp. HBU206391]|uniref:MarR family winged helix-turn-helix transcriptional regulator n=1 Tax=Actinomadura sp. HBU206391 TaxID=2731692 RepID=UPI001C9D0E95|nr:MarR family transcriptional regulator [Actinomadura sp. HBU206391]
MISESVSSSQPPILLLQRATHATLHALSAAVADLGMTPSEINALANLADGPPRSLAELSAATGTRATTLTGVLDRLERRGHLIRRSHPTDRRAVLLEVTPTGADAAAEVRKAIAELEGRLLGDLPAEAIAGFRAVASALTEVAV